MNSIYHSDSDFEFVFDGMYLCDWRKSYFFINKFFYLEFCKIWSGELFQFIVKSSISAKTYCDEYQVNYYSHIWMIFQLDISKVTSCYTNSARKHQYSYIDNRFGFHRSPGQHKLCQHECKYLFLHKNSFLAHDNCSWHHSLIHQIHHRNFQSRRIEKTDEDNLDFLLK